MEKRNLCFNKVELVQDPASPNTRESSTEYVKCRYFTLKKTGDIVYPSDGPLVVTLRVRLACRASNPTHVAGDNMWPLPTLQLYSRGWADLGIASTVDSKDVHFVRHICMQLRSRGREDLVIGGIAVFPCDHEMPPRRSSG